MTQKEIVEMLQPMCDQITDTLSAVSDSDLMEAMAVTSDMQMVSMMMNEMIRRVDIGVSIT